MEAFQRVRLGVTEFPGMLVGKKILTFRAKRKKKKRKEEIMSL